MKKLICYLNETLTLKKKILFFLFILFLCGVISGSLFINFISKEDKTILVKQILDYTNNCKNLSNIIYGFSALKNELLNNELQLLLIFLLGLSVFGILFVIILIFFKGFMLGTSLSIMIYNFKFKGIVLMLFYLVPGFIFNILIYIFISFFAINTSLYFINAFLKKGNLNFKQFLGKYLLSFIISFILFIISSSINTFLTPLLIRIFTYI